MAQRQFIWTDDLVARFVTWSLSGSPLFQGRYADIEQFKKMHSSLSVEDVLQERNAQPSEYKGSLTRPLTPNEAYPPAAEPKGKEWEILNYDFIKYPETKTVDMKDPRAIHSVRRLSDNEEFSVGETVIVKPSGDYKKTIKAFAVYGNDMRVYLDGWDDSTALYCLTKAAPARTPLFTTTDGEEISESQSLVLVFAVTPKWEIMECSAEFANPNTYKEKAGQEPLFKVFFHKQSAVDYIADNKPLYSLNDLLAALPDEASKEGIAQILRLNKQPKQ